MVGIRRANAKSDDSGYASSKLAFHAWILSCLANGSLSIDPEHSFTVEEWVARKDKFRVVSDGLPMPFPLRSLNSNPELDHIYETRVKPLIPQVLRQYGIAFTIMRLDFWYPPYEKSKGRETLVVQTTDIQTSSWTSAASAIKGLFLANGANNIVAGIQVEIHNPREMYYDFSQLLPDDAILLEALSQIREGVSKAASKHLGRAWSSIAYHMRVRHDAAVDTAKKPTVIVFCYPGATGNFESAEEEINQILNTTPIKIHVEILLGQITLADVVDERPVHLTNIPAKPYNGASIGIEGNKDAAGTLGGWVILNLPKQKKQIPCALTCYHVIRASDKSIAEHTDKNGIRSDDPRGQVIVEYPAAYDARYTLKNLDTSLQEYPDDADLSKDRTTLLSLMSNPGIGRVILSSGHLVEENHRLDWALIESPRTFSPNKPAPKSALIQTAFELPPTLLYRLNSDSKVRSFGQVKLGDWVIKRGRTTYYTSGQINKMYREVQWPSGYKTMEIEIKSEAGEFASPGDSGAIVTNTQGELVGLLFAKDSYPSQFSFGIMTPITFIQQHVREVTGGGFLSLD